MALILKPQNDHVYILDSQQTANSIIGYVDRMPKTIDVHASGAMSTAMVTLLQHEKYIELILCALHCLMAVYVVRECPSMAAFSIF